jgi:hypothetical protein
MQHYLQNGNLKSQKLLQAAKHGKFFYEAQSPSAPRCTSDQPGTSFTEVENSHHLLPKKTLKLYASQNGLQRRCHKVHAT